MSYEHEIGTFVDLRYINFKRVPPKKKTLSEKLRETTDQIVFDFQNGTMRSVRRIEVLSI